MTRSVLLACAALLAACGPMAAPDASALRRPPAVRPADRTTRLVLPTAVPSADIDCADLADRSAAQDVLRSDPRDPHRLDADRDGAACEKLDP